MIGLSLGFQPQELTKRTSRPEGGGRTEAPPNTASIKNILRPFGARRDVVFLGLKPQAESYHPFGIKSDKPFGGQDLLSNLSTKSTPHQTAFTRTRMISTRNGTGTKRVRRPC